MSSSVNGTNISPAFKLSPSFNDLGGELGMEVIMAATVTAGICYGFLAMLCYNCFSVLLRAKHLYSRRMQLIFLAYVVTMFLLSTGALVQQIGYMIWNFKSLVEPSLWFSISPWGLATIPYTMPFILWGTDGLLMWRCLILYQGIPRAGDWTIKILLIILSLTSLGTGISYYYVSQNQDVLNPNWINFVIGTSRVSLEVLIPSVNFILTSLLAARILYKQAQLRTILGSARRRSSPYTKTAMICIESSALIVVVAVAGLAVNAYEFPLVQLPHICVISSLLIVYRVAQGRSFEAVTSGSGGGRMTAINFRDNTVPSEC
ncbi:hypothetical protein D9613_010487 [Agrocybe pediades]|uniref:Uncharacterized protein n=1 Tax=Agrocybe pediades TaxID=84607 RepID=A0A8H4QFJ1_9AGAR|nr:hypothetical protein D9613_010487 [Agrocybe pediades]